MGHEETDAIPSTPRSGSSTTSSAEENETMEAYQQEHSYETKIAQVDSSEAPASPVRRSYLYRTVLFTQGDGVLILVRLSSHLSILSVKVVPGWIQDFCDEFVVVYCRYGLGRVSKSAVLAHCRAWSEDVLKQMTAARTEGWTLEQLPLMEEVFEGSLFGDGLDSPSLPGLSQPSSKMSASSNSSRNFASHLGKSQAHPNRSKPRDSYQVQATCSCRSHNGQVQEQAGQGFPEVPMAYFQPQPAYTVIYCPQPTPRFYTQLAMPYTYFPQFQ